MQNLSAGSRKSFGIWNVLVSICSLNSVVHSHLSGLWLHADCVCVCVWRAEEVELQLPISSPLGSTHHVYTLY